MPFANSYTFSGGGRFRRLIPTADGMLAIGADGDLGLVARLGPDGTVIWSRTYQEALVGMTLEFVDGVAASNGDFVLVAVPGSHLAANLQALTRIDGAGNVIWSRRIESGAEAARVLCNPGPPEEFLFYVRAPRDAAGSGGASFDIVDLVRFDANGDLLGSARLSANRGGRIFDAMVVSDSDAMQAGNYLLVGDLDPGLTAVQWGQADPAAEFEAMGKAGLAVFISTDLMLSACCFVRENGAVDGLVSLRALGVDATGTILLAGAVMDAGRAAEAFVAAMVTPDHAVFGGCRIALDDPGTRPERLCNLTAKDFPASGLFPNVEPAYFIEFPPDEPYKSTPPGNALILIGHRPDAAAEISQIVEFDTALTPHSRHAFAFDDASCVFDLASANDTATVSGSLPAPPLGAAFVLSMDESLACCRLRELGTPAYQPIQFDIDIFDYTFDMKLTPTTSVVGPLFIVASPTEVAVASACAGTAVDIGDGTLLQSPCLNLQAAGSDGTDASRGILLRWFLTGALENHLPKGGLAQGTLNFNKPDDFVTLYRAEFPTAVATRRLDFATDRPVYVDDGARTLYFETGTATPRDLFAVWLMDAAGYAAAKQAADPTANLAGFLAAYGANPLEVELRGTVAVACDVVFQASGGGSVQIEARSVGESGILADKHVTVRRTLQAADGPTARLYAENMRSVRLRGLSAQIKSVAFLRYEDVIGDVNARRAWTEIGPFSLSLDQNEVFRRLEDPSRFTVNDLWRKYDSAARVNVANYRTRWTDAPQGLAAAVQTYVQLSESDPTATATLTGANPEDGAISASYLDLLQIAAAADYHVARMFGLGFVDADAEDGPSYIHLIAYRTLGDLGDGQGARDVRHLYIGLPTTLAQSRLPLTPDLDSVEYGLTVPTGSGVPYALTDAQGYTPDGTTRYIRLYPGCRPLYLSDGDFFDPPDAIDYAAMSLPLLYGVEYRRQSDSAWHKPAIAHDTSFNDTASPPVAEVLTTPFPATQRASAFIHKETDPGIHVYSVYGVNLFSRASPPGTPKATDATVFTPRNSLLPPSDLQVQYIQPESPLMLTTSHEQDLLSQIAQADKTLVRFCCNYGMAQETAYGFADTIELFHRQQLPANVTGGVVSIAPASDPALLRIETGPYTFQSPGGTVVPTLAQAMKANFVGGVLVAGGTRLTVEDIQWPAINSGDNPIFLVRKPTMTGVIHDSGANTVSVQDAPLTIAPGDLVMAVENMAAASSWGGDNPLTATIQIGGTNWSQRTEGFVRPDGTSVSRHLRGIWDTATVAAASVGDPLKLYDIVFDNVALQAHAQSSDPVNPVNWWKGTVRLPVVGHDPEDRRTLKVVQIVSDFGNRLELRALDDSGEPDDVVTSGSPLVNYYPGYLVYLRADANRLFDSAHLLPAPGEGSRTTLIGARSKDSSTLDGAGAPYCSALSVPQLVAALEIREPMPPRKPHGLAYATPPDAYYKSSYTLNVEFDHEPFAAVFYRADALTMLTSIYSDASVAGIRATIFAAEGDPYLTNRFEDLFAYLDDTRTAPDQIPNSGDFAMPVPDAPELNLPSGALSAADKAAVKAALYNAFVPLSEQPLIYDFISSDPAFVPTNAPQNFRNANGDVLAPGDPGFNLSPMAMRPGANAIRFVDFTLDGSMNPNTLCFYCVREIGNRMQIGDASAIFGPVKLVNLAPPRAPRLRKLTSVPADVASGTGPRIAFEVIAPAAIDPIFALRIYRSSSAVDALSVRSMVALPDIELATLAPSTDGILQVSDDFSEDNFVPFGDPLFYRLAWVRRVTYEDANQLTQSAQAISDPTRTYLGNVVDVTNPAAPVPALSVLTTASNGDKFLRATWPKAVHNATYYLSRLVETGNWMRLGALKSNADTLTFDLADALPPANEDGDPIYYRFKVDLENSSGLLNTSSSPVTVRLDQLQ